MKIKRYTGLWKSSSINLWYILATDISANLDNPDHCRKNLRALVNQPLRW